MTKKMMDGGVIRILVVVALISSPMIDSSQGKKDGSCWHMCIDYNL